MLSALLLATLASSNPADAAPPYVHDYTVYGIYLTACPVSWDDFIDDHMKSGAEGLDPITGDYAIGWVYQSLSTPVVLRLYDAADTYVGVAAAWYGGTEYTAGDITDIEPVIYLDSCTAPTLPNRYAIRVTTVGNPGGFIVGVR